MHEDAPTVTVAQVQPQTSFVDMGLQNMGSSFVDMHQLQNLGVWSSGGNTYANLPLQNMQNFVDMHQLQNLGNTFADMHLQNMQLLRGYAPAPEPRRRLE